MALILCFHPQTASSRRDLTNSFQDQPCDSPVLAEPLNIATMLNDERAKRHVENISRAALSRMPHLSGRPVFDVFLNKVVAHEMPNHFIDIHSQRRIRTLDSYDDLTLPEFLQGYIAMLSKMQVQDPVYRAMVQWLGPLGQVLVDYQWQGMSGRGGCRGLMRRPEWTALTRLSYVPPSGQAWMIPSSR